MWYRQLGYNGLATYVTCSSLKIPTGNHITDASFETSNAVLKFNEIGQSLVPIASGISPVIAAAGHCQILETRGLLTKIDLHCLLWEKSGEAKRTVEWKLTREANKPWLSPCSRKLPLQRTRRTRKHPGIAKCGRTPPRS